MLALNKVDRFNVAIVAIEKTMKCRKACELDGTLHISTYKKMLLDHDKYIQENDKDPEYLDDIMLQKPKEEPLQTRR
jgi:phosphoketolase